MDSLEKKFNQRMDSFEKRLSALEKNAGRMSA